MLAVCQMALVLALAREATIDLRQIPPGASCPSASMLDDALEARLPGVAERGASPDGRSVLRLELAEKGSGGVHFALVDDGGRPLLERTLALPDGAATDRTADRSRCAVRAETIALVVERYLRQLGYRTRFPAPEAPALRSEPTAPMSLPSPRAPLRFILAAGIGVRPDTRGPTRTEPELVGEIVAGRLTLSFRLALTLPIDVPIAVAIPVAIPTSTGPGTFRYQALPLRLGIGVPLFLPRRIGWVAPTLLAGIDVFSAETRGIAGPGAVRGVEPTAELGLVAMLHVAAGLALRPQALVQVRQERAFQLSDAAPGGPPVFVDPWFSLRLGVDLAYSFGKK